MNKDLRIVFMGTPEFAVASLKALHEAKHHIVGVITTADKRAGRGKKLQLSAVKQYALANDIPVLTPLNLKDPEFLQSLNEWQANLQVVVAFRMLPEVIWQAPKYGTFNLHASLLPQYRGAAPINHAIINGETETGVTTFFLDKQIDTGRIIEQKKCKILETETAGELHDKLMDIGSELVLSTVQLIISDNLKTLDQSEATNEVILKKAPKIFKEDGEINWNKDAIIINNRIRGLSPYPAAWTTLKNMHKNTELKLKIFSASISAEKSSKSGYLVTDNKTYLRIQTSDYNIEVQELQLQGKKRMNTKDFLRGFQNIDEMICITSPNP